MKKFVFALVAILFTSFAFAMTPVVDTGQESEKFEFVKQFADQAIVVTTTNQSAFDYVYHQQKTVNSQSLLVEPISITSKPLSFNLPPIDKYKGYDYQIDKRNWCRISNKNKVLI